jgi:hypothetical protein
LHSEIQKRKELAVAPAGADAVLIGSVTRNRIPFWGVRTRLDIKDTFGPPGIEIAASVITVL